MRLLIPVLFFFSGLTALVASVIWMRMLSLVLGNTLWAAATAGAAWLGGIAIGSRLAAILAPRLRLHLRWYGLVNAAIALLCVLSPVMFTWLLQGGRLLGADPGQSLSLAVIQRFLLALLALLPATVLIGLTLPILVERLRAIGLVARTALLYGMGTLGAATGVVLTVYFLLPILGERGSLAAAGVACAMVAAVAIACEAHVISEPSPEPLSAPAVSVDSSPQPRWYPWLVAIMGMSVPAAGLVWLRILVLYLGSRVSTLALLLAVSLLGIAAGSLLVRAFAGRISDHGKALARVQLAAAAALTLQLPLLGFAGLLLPASEPAALSFAWAQAAILPALLILLLPVTMLFGASLPLAVAAHPGPRREGAHAGLVVTAGALGALAGALGTAFVLVPALGCQRALLVLAALHLLVAIGLRRRREMVTLVVTVLAALMWLVPGDWLMRRVSNDGRGELVELSEGRAATVQVKQYNDPETRLSLVLNGVETADSSPASLAVQQLQGVLPLLQHPAPRQVLEIGFGTGTTCWAVSRFPVEQIDLVESAPEVLALAATQFAFINYDVLQDQRLRVIHNDGRSYLAATDQSYDVIISDSRHPVFAGNSNLYTVEYFRLCREHLNPAGVVAMQLPLSLLDQEGYLRILAAFHEVFPNTLVWYTASVVNQQTVVTGRVEPSPPVFSWQMLDDPELAAALAGAGINQPADLVADLILGPREVRQLTSDVPSHQDDLPYVEYLAGRALDRESTWFDNLVMLWTFRSRALPPSAAAKADAGLIPRRDRIFQEHLRIVRRKDLGQ